MPIYEYRCLDCREEFELLVLSRSLADDVSCSACGGTHVERKVSAVGCCGSDSGSDRAGSMVPGCGRSGFS